MRVPVGRTRFPYLFTDHADQVATVVYHNSRGCAPPPLATYAIYFTSHLTAGPLLMEMAHRLFTNISDSLAYNDAPFGLELFYLPGKDAESCMQHHMHERQARGSYDPQIEAIKGRQRRAISARLTDQDVFHHSHRPGLPKTYLQHEEFQAYHQLFFICHSPSWDNGEGLFELVEYEPMSPERFAALNLDPEDYAADPSPAIVPAQKCRGLQAVSREVFELGEDDNTVGDVWETIRMRSRFEEIDGETGTAGLFNEASSRGWMHW